MTDATVADIPTGMVVADPDQPRVVFDEDELQILAASIAEVGQKVPIIVTPSNGGAEFMLVDGERRHRAATMAGLETVRAIIETDIGDRFESQLVSNFCRAGHTPMEISNAIAKVRGAGATFKKTAAMFGKSEMWVAQYLKLQNLMPSVAASIETGHSRKGLRLVVAFLIADLPKENQSKFARRVAGKPLKRAKEILFATGEIKKVVPRAPRKHELLQRLMAMSEEMQERIQVFTLMEEAKFDAVFEGVNAETIEMMEEMFDDAAAEMKTLSKLVGSKA